MVEQGDINIVPPKYYSLYYRDPPKGTPSFWEAGRCSATEYRDLAGAMWDLSRFKVYGFDAAK